MRGNTLLILGGIGGALYFLTRQQAPGYRTPPVVSAPGYLPGATSYLPSAQDVNPVIVNNSPNSTPAPVVVRSTSSPTTNLGEAVQTIQEVRQVAATIAEIVTAPAVAATIAEAVAAPIVATEVATTVTSAAAGGAVTGGAVTGGAVAGGAVATEAAGTVLGLGLVGTAAVILAPVLLLPALLIAALGGDPQGNSAASLLAKNQATELDKKTYGQYGYTTNSQQMKPPLGR